MSDKVRQWVRAAVVRAVKTVAQTAAATIGTSAVLSAVDWTMVILSLIHICVRRYCHGSRGHEVLPGYP